MMIDGVVDTFFRINIITRICDYRMDKGLTLSFDKARIQATCEIGLRIVHITMETVMNRNLYVVE